MPTRKIVPLVLAGGNGSRLWPLSSSQSPKQFLRLVSDQSLLQHTLMRCGHDCFDPSPIVVTAAVDAVVAFRQTGKHCDLILEPVGRNTASAIAVGALRALQRDSEAVVLALASDHHIENAEAFLSSVLLATAAAEQGWIVTFGVQPSQAACGYGYIAKGEQTGVQAVHRVARFVEKPNAERAADYLKDGYFWNSGNFLFKASRLLEELEKFSPTVLHNAKLALAKAELTSEGLLLDAGALATTPSVSIDCAVMERTEWAAVLPVSYGWSDIGKWEMVAALGSNDDRGNRLVGSAVVESTSNSFVRSEGILTAVVGCEDIVVVSTPRAVLVLKKGHGEDVKLLVERLKTERPEFV